MFKWLKSEKRKSLYISPFQMHFLVFTGLITFCYAASFFVTNTLLYLYFIQRGEAARLPVDNIFYDLVLAQRNSMHLVAFILAIFVVSLTWYLSLKLSHRVVGPVQKIQQTLEAHAKGEAVKPIRLREGDFFHELATAANNYIQKTGRTEGP